MENASLPGCAKPVSSREREGRLAAGAAAIGSGLPAAAPERGDGKASPGLLVARFRVLFFGELCPLLCWPSDFIQDRSYLLMRRQESKKRGSGLAISAAEDISTGCPFNRDAVFGVSMTYPLRGGPYSHGQYSVKNGVASLAVWRMVDLINVVITGSQSTHAKYPTWMIIGLRLTWAERTDIMKPIIAHGVAAGLQGVAICLWAICQSVALATDWPQYRGPTTDGVSLERIATDWSARGPLAGWTNMSLKNGFSSFAISRGRAFTLISQNPGGGRLECCVAVDAVTGTNIWSTPIGNAPWDPSVVGWSGGVGTSPLNTGDGPRTTPAVEGGSVFVLSAHMVLTSLNWTNGATNWTKDLVALYGASEPNDCISCPYSDWNNGASPLLDNGLIFVNLNTATDNKPLCAFSTIDGSRVWASQNSETYSLTHSTPVVATIEGVRQVIFRTWSRLISLDCSTGSNLWQFTYPFTTDPTIIRSLGASPVVYSNIVYCTEGYWQAGAGAAAAQITRTGSTWQVQLLYHQDDSSYYDPHYRNLWMTPVCYQGYLYTLCGGWEGSFAASPLNCIELSTGNLKWSVNGFGRGGIILVNRYLLVLTEDGQLVLVQPDPGGYTELARCRAFQFTAGAPGKCWNSPAYSNGRIYARSTTGGVSFDVSVPQPPQLQLFPPQFLSSSQLRLLVGTTNAAPIDSNRLANIEVRATNQLGGTPLSWPKLTNPLVLTTNGLGMLTNGIDGTQTQLFFMTIEHP